MERAPDLRRLRIGNVVVGVVLVVEVVAIAALSNGFSLPVTASFMTGPPGSALPPQHTLFNLPIGPAVAAFLAMAALDHLLVASPRLVGWYERHLLGGINYARWIEYSLSASLMVVLISMLTGISDIRALIAIFGVNAAMILFGLLMERWNSGRENVDWLPFWFGCVAGIVPWIAITLSIVGSQIDSPTGVPGFVYGIFVSLFVFFNIFAVNQVLQYRRVGRWRDYL
jgi:bacteriorhodopsin